MFNVNKKIYVVRYVMTLQLISTQKAVPLEKSQKSV